MKPEIEAKFVGIDIADVRDALTRLGAECVQPMRLMRRALVETDDMRKNQGFLRLRDEGDKVTLTYKQFLPDNGAHSAEEYEVVVSDFATTKLLLEHSGLAFQTYQESRRETWRYGQTEIVIDEWPWLEPYIEIEDTNEADVRQVAEQLGYVWDAAVFGGADVLYAAKYEFSDGVRGVIDIADVRFDQPLPAAFTLR